MTGLTSGTALLIALVFVLPGFVAVLVKERIYEVRGEQSAFDRLLTTVYYSLLVWAVPTAVAVVAGAHRRDIDRFFHGRSPLWLTGLLAATVLLVLPTVAAYLAWVWIRSDRRLRLLDRLHLPPTHRVPTSWDFAFDGEQDLLLVVTLRDGGRVAGYYGPRSHSGYGTNTRDLFLEERWDFTEDGSALAGPAHGSVGFWINAEDIVAIEQYALSDDQQREITGA